MVDQTYENRSPLNPLDRKSFGKTSWGAVFAGVVLVLMIQILLSILGTGLGTSAIDPMEPGNMSASSMGMGVGIWWAISSVIALFVGGWVAGYLSGISNRVDAMLHGVLTWALATLLAIYLLTSAVGKVLGGAYNVLGSVASGAGNAISAVAPQVASSVADKAKRSDIGWDDIKREAQTLLKQTGKSELDPNNLKKQGNAAISDAKSAGATSAKNPDAADIEADTLIDKLFQQGKGIANEADREAAINLLMARSNMSREEATTTVKKWEQQYLAAQAKLEETKKKAAEQAKIAADKTAKAVSTAAIWGFIALVLGCIAAAIGGALARAKTTVRI